VDDLRQTLEDPIVHVGFHEIGTLETAIEKGTTSAAEKGTRSAIEKGTT